MNCLILGWVTKAMINIVGTTLGVTINTLSGWLQRPATIDEVKALTAEIAGFVRDTGAIEGLVTLFIRHTSASLTIQENADPSVLADMITALDRLAPEDAGWRHDAEGPDDMPAHVKTMLTGTSLQIPVIRGEPMLGTWQAIYLIEHRRHPHPARSCCSSSGPLAERPGCAVGGGVRRPWSGCSALVGQRFRSRFRCPKSNMPAAEARGRHVLRGPEQ